MGNEEYPSRLYGRIGEVVCCGKLIGSGVIGPGYTPQGFSFFDNMIDPAAGLRRGDATGDERGDKQRNEQDEKNFISFHSAPLITHI